MWFRQILLGVMVVFVLVNCGESNPSPEHNPIESVADAPQLSSEEEDVLMLKLSADLIATPSTQAEVDQNTIVNYAIDQLLDVQRTSTGLYYAIKDSGAGELLAWGDRVAVHYQGKFPEGNIFDSSYRRKEPLTFYIGNMIDGWNEGLQLLRPGGKAVLLVPGHLGYGEEGLKLGEEKYLVPPNQVLIFDLEVLEKK